MRKTIVFCGVFIGLLTNIIYAQASGSLTQNLSSIKDLVSNQNSNLLKSDLSGVDSNSIANIRNNYFQNKSNNYADMNNIGNDMIILDKNFNPDLYIVGTEDVISIYLWGTTEEKITLPIDVEGNTVIPRIGSVKVGGETFTNVKKILLERIESNYKNVKCSISLISMRMIKIYVTGNIKSPGSYIVNPVTRVSDVISAAGGILENGKKRGIEIKNSILGDITADFASFVNSNEINKNPYIRDGDQIYIPVKKEQISIQGAIAKPGEYDYCYGDNIQSIVIAAGGFKRDADTNNIIVTRFRDDGDSLETICLKEYASSVNFALFPEDRILVTSFPKFRALREVRISGEVVYPGVYPIRDDKTTLKDVVDMAGGLASEAYLPFSKIIRKNKIYVGDRELQRIRATPSAALSPVEQSFVKAKIKEDDGLIRINSENIVGVNDNLNSIILRENDEITIARKELSVRVSGGVTLPGLVSFSNEKKLKDYIENAGGYSNNAIKRKVSIINGQSEIIYPYAKCKNIEPGDIILVPEKQYHDKFIMTKDIIVVIGSIATIALTIFTIDSYIKDNN